MNIKTAIFDMDGLLLDTEPLWGKSMLKVALQHQIPIRQEHFKITTGLRIYEVTEYWAERFPWQGTASPQQVAEEVLDDIIALSKSEGGVMKGAEACLDWLKKHGVKIGLATSSPMRMVQELIPYFGLEGYFDITFSADTALFGKPHPEVYLACAKALDALPWNCVAFEDSVNGMISAKAARMKVVVVPDPERFNNPHFNLADVKLSSLEEFNEKVWNDLNS